jgi:protease PrsW
MLAIRSVAIRERAAGLRSSHWPAVFYCGTGLWLAAIAVTAATGNALLLPTDIMAGSFVVPVTAVVWIFEQGAGSMLTPWRVVVAFVAGGGLSMLVAVLLEKWLLPSGGMRSAWVGMIEEVAKATMLVIIAVGRPRFGARSGVLLGAAVGFGYAALESSGYALNAFNGLLGPAGLGNGLGYMFHIEAERAVPAPVLHGLWTAFLGGVIVRSASRARPVRAVPVMIGALLLIVALHASWDATDDFAAFMAAAMAHSAAASVLQSAAFPSTAVAVRLAVCVVGAAAVITVWRGERRLCGAVWGASKGLTDQGKTLARCVPQPREPGQGSREEWGMFACQTLPSAPTSKTSTPAR